MSLTVVATPLPTDAQPRIRLDVTDSAGGSASFTVTRTDPDGRVRKVITEPNPHVTSGTWSGFDYHAPFNQPVTYTVVTTVSATSSAVTLSMSASWLIHRTNPGLSIQVSAINTIADRTSPSTAATHFPFGAEFPVTRNEGVRRARSGSFTIRAESKNELDDIDSLLHDSGVILMNFTNGDPTAWFDETWAWIQPGDLQFMNPEGNGWVYYPNRRVQIPYQIVDVPAGAITPVWTYATLLADTADFPSYTAVGTGYHNYADVVTDTRA